jgi:hypothetical protein
LKRKGESSGWNGGAEATAAREEMSAGSGTREDDMPEKPGVLSGADAPEVPGAFAEPPVVRALKAAKASKSEAVEVNEGSKPKEPTEEGDAAVAVPAAPAGLLLLLAAAER